VSSDGSSSLAPYDHHTSLRSCWLVVGAGPCRYANWSYQAGVFISRSSGTAFSPSLNVLWALPLLQLALLAFFSWTAVEHVWCADQPPLRLVFPLLRG
jgi:hypothetical protein